MKPTPEVGVMEKTKLKKKHCYHCCARHAALGRQRNLRRRTEPKGLASHEAVPVRRVLASLIVTVMLNTNTGAPSTQPIGGLGIGEIEKIRS